MTDNFTCPSCGWPQGPTHTPTFDDGEDIGPLAAPQPGLVERLRGWCWGGENVYHELTAADNIMDEAADALEGAHQELGRQAFFREQDRKELDAAKAEIERLNNLCGVQVAQSFYRDLCEAKAENERLREAYSELEANDRKEIMRLRAALEKIADEKIIGTIYPTQIARAAITGRGE